MVGFVMILNYLYNYLITPFSITTDGMEEQNEQFIPYGIQNRNEDQWIMPYQGIYPSFTAGFISDLGSIIISTY